MLFLFINCVYAAAPVITYTEDYKEAVSLHLAQSPYSETEEESRPAGSACVIQQTHFSHKQKGGRIYNAIGRSNVTLFSFEKGPQRSSPASLGFLPTPGYYAFLFRYNLF
jgi:hypothetical protein